MRFQVQQNPQHWLEFASWISQIVLATVAVLAAFVAYGQLRAFKLLEVLKLIESLPIRKARRTVLKEIPKRGDAEWWDDKEDGDRLESAAADVCASYDILGLMIEHDLLARVWFGYGRFFRKYWANSITDCHRVLKPYLDYRRKRNPDAYPAFTRLADTARRA